MTAVWMNYAIARETRPDLKKNKKNTLVKSRDLRPHSVFLFIGEQNIPNGCRVRDLKTAEVL